MAEQLLPHFSRIFITTPGTFKASDPQKVYEQFAAGVSKQEQDRVIFIRETKGAVLQALELGRAEGLPVLGAGSFYLAAEIRSLCKG
jgi:dihydrofolate synthase/folylpolyglutamate synthase